MQLGNVLKELRQIQGKSQQDIADKIGISRSVLSQYENNLVEPTAYVVKKIAIYFDVSADYLLGLEDDFGVRPTDTMGDTYSSEEREIIIKYRRLPDKIKKLVRDQLEIYGERSELLPNKNKNG